MYTLKTDAHKLYRTLRYIRWNRDEVAAAIAAAGCGGRKYPFKVRVLKDKVGHFNHVTLYDIENKVLRPMKCSYRRQDFADYLELDDPDLQLSGSDTEREPEPSVAREKNPKRVAAGKLSHYQRLKKQHALQLKRERTFNKKLAAANKKAEALKLELHDQTIHRRAQGQGARVRQDAV